jgi:hypothetical protein
MVKMRFAWVLVGLVLLFACGAGLAKGVEVSFYAAGDATVGMFANAAGTAVTGLHIEFDREVTITNKVEFGGYLPALGAATGATFDFNGGSLVANGGVELDWKPAEARPTLFMWMNVDRPVGTPYFTTIDKLGWLLAEGIVHLREANPAALQAALAQFFADNGEFFGMLSASLGMNLQETLLPVIMTAPAEGIQNFFNTMIGMLGVTDLQGLLTSQVNLSALLTLLGL